MFTIEAGETLACLYEKACRHPSDINEHCPILFHLAGQCKHATEMGTRGGISTIALLLAQPIKLVCYDTHRSPAVDILKRLAGRTELVFHQKNVLDVEIESTDLLFIDTYHTYEQLKKELDLHAQKVANIIVLHDTTTFGEHGEEPGSRGLWPAITEFLEANAQWRLKARHTHNNGLTVLQRHR